MVDAILGVVGIALSAAGMISQQIGMDDQADAIEKQSKANANLIRRRARVLQEMNQYKMSKYDDQIWAFKGQQQFAMNQSRRGRSGFDNAFVAGEAENMLDFERMLIVKDNDFKVQQMLEEADVLEQTGALQAGAISSQAWGTLLSGTADIAIRGSQIDWGSLFKNSPVPTDPKVNQ